MDLSTLTKAPGARKKRKRLGRGSSSGTGQTAGRGEKGQKSRSGYSRRGGFEGGQMPLHRRLPKRGFHQDVRFPFALVNVERLECAFESGAEVTPETLAAAGIVEPSKGGVKILGRGELTKKLAVKANAISAGARQKIEAAGGTVELIRIPSWREAKAKRSAEEER
ncbi:MAG: 50S ribosomal protein L15 [Candidatus Hydrogenedentes bacterium]|nr:50S ribosomal protein L15 [Candidatus Hydrogenedentota bacterium]